ncbi:MAG: hypothetical protein WCE54_00950 [Ignavibacteriaceae bacterium]
MPVYKYKSLKEASDALLVKVPDENYYKMLSGFYETFGELFTKKFPHGVYKFKTIKEAQEQKERWILGKII